LEKEEKQQLKLDLEWEKLKKQVDEQTRLLAMHKKSNMKKEDSKKSKVILN